MARNITIRKPDDFHVHMREGDVLRSVAPCTARHFARALIMPNTTVPILTWRDAMRYRDAVRMAANTASFEPLMTIKITDATTSREIMNARKNGVLVGKAYPAGVTTNADDGVRDFKKCSDVFAAMEGEGMILSLHGEDPDPAVLIHKKEKSFLPILDRLADVFPSLKIVFEHVSTKEAVYLIRAMPDTVAATVTVHHLMLTMDDVVGSAVRPHHFCKPIPKTADDRAIIQDVVKNGNRKFFFGSDSAPHLRTKKECAAGAAGIFSSPVALAVLAEFFASHGIMEKLENFVSTFGAEFYGLPLNTETIILSEEEWVVPEEYENIVPFMAGKKLPWIVK